MKCSYCGYENSQNAKFCSGCGKPLENLELTQTMKQPILENRGVSTERFNDTYRAVAPKTSAVRGKKKKSANLKALVISISAVLACLVAFLIIYFCTDVFGKNCKICNSEFNTDGQYCESCVEEYTCKGCEEIKKSVEDGICKDCMDDFTCTECGKTDLEINKSLCTSCAEEYTCENCGEIDFGTKDGYCRECTEDYVCTECNNFDKELEEGLCQECVKIYTCKDCEIFDKAIKDNYCDDCKKNHICKDCGNVEENLANGYCEKCAEKGEKDWCYYCDAQINTLTAYKDKDGYFYCASCNTGKYCASCKAPVDSGKIFCKYCD